MTEIVNDFVEINRRVNRRPEQNQKSPGHGMAMVDAAIRTLQALGYTYNAGAQMWKPPLGALPSGAQPYVPNVTIGGCKYDPELAARQYAEAVNKPTRMLKRSYCIRCDNAPCKDVSKCSGFSAL